MKWKFSEILACAILIASLVGFTTSVVGCKQVAASLPTGALNTFDADSYESLMVAQATLNTLKADAPAIEVSVPQFKTVLNQAIADYNIAENAWQTYHDGGANGPAVTTALSTLATDILKVQGLIPTASVVTNNIAYTSGGAK